MPTLVTGATGLVGNNLVRLLLQRGEAVRALVRAGCDPRPLKGLDVETIEGDVCDLESMRRACKGASAVIHSAGVVRIGWAGKQQYRDVNVMGTDHVVTAAHEAGVRLIHVSTVNALGVLRSGEPADEETPLMNNVPCPYVVTKQAAELIVLDEVSRGLDGLIVNLGFMLGPWDWKPSSGRMLLEVAARYTPFAPRGGCAVCDVRDVAAAILTAVKCGRAGERYILGGHNISYLDLWQMMADVTHTSRPFFRMNKLMGFAGCCWGDLMTRITGREGRVNSALIRMSAQLHYYSSAKAEAELGFHSRCFEESVRDAWEWFKEYGYVCRGTAGAGS